METLIKSLENKTKRLSYSSIKNLNSPINFLNYYLKERKETPSLIKGRLLDCLILTPHLFDSTYKIAEAMPTTDMQVTYCDLAVKGLKENMTLEEATKAAFTSVYSKSTKLDHLNEYIYAKSKVLGVVSSELYEQCNEISSNLLKQSEVSEILEQMEEVQLKLEFKYKGWNFLSYLDAWEPNLFCDLKYTQDSDPSRFEYDLRKWQYDVQFGLYSIGLEVLGLSENTPFCFITYDDSLNYSIIDVDDGYINYGKKKVDFYIDCLDKMISEKSYNKSYNHFKSKTKVYKPKWIEGFDYEIFNENI